MTAGSDSSHKGIRLALLASYVIGIGWILIRSGDPVDPAWWMGAIPFLGWMLSPIAVPLLIRLRSWLLTGGVATMGAYSLYVYERDMFGSGVTSTSALIFIFLPAYLWLGTAILNFIAYMVRRRSS